MYNSAVMKVKYLEIQNFKRFADLKIDFEDLKPKLVVLVGLNGSGKSSVFDAFEQIGGRNKPGFNEDQTYLRKDQNNEYSIVLDCGDRGKFSKGNPPEKRNIYLRSSYRFDPEFQVNNFQQKDSVLQDSIRPKKMIELDKRVQDNYERLVGNTLSGVYSGSKDQMKVHELREELIGEMRRRMEHVFTDLLLEGTGNPFSEGTFFFTKGDSKHFPYKNLSSGEKGAFDILLDLITKNSEFNDTIIAIDEPELHMHSSLQRSLLKEVYELIQNPCQLWISTHSIGFIRGAIELLKEDRNEVALLDFTNLDFDKPQVIKPIKPTSAKVREIFQIAIDDLASMMVPSKIVICEGSLNAPDDSAKKEFDTKIYNTIFTNEDVLFVSGDNKESARKSAELLFKIIKLSGSIRDISSIVDRDNLTPKEVEEYKSKNPSQKFLSRKEIENYLLDFEIVEAYCNSNGVDKTKLTSKLVDPIGGDAKSIQAAIRIQCGFSGSDEEFKFKLAEYIKPGTKVFEELTKDIEL